jgi:hypothetical protein
MPSSIILKHENESVEHAVVFSVLSIGFEHYVSR